MSAPELAACPFCGGEGRHTEEIDDGRAWLSVVKVGSAFYVECCSCETSGPFGDDEAEAIAAWNRRSPDLTALRAQVETLREALSGLIDWFDTNGIEDSRLDEARAAVSRDDTSEVSDG